MDEASSVGNLGRDLSKLPKSDKKNQLASFIKEQQRNVRIYEAEGRKFVETWDKENVSVASNIQRQGASKVSEGRAGIMTPVLKPRNPRYALEAPKGQPAVGLDIGRKIQAPKERSKDIAEALKGKSRVVEKERVTSVAAEVSKRSKKKNPPQTKVPSQDKRSDTEEEDTEKTDQRIRMDRRKEKRRERREVVNPKKRKNSVELENIDPSEDGVQGKARAKRAKIPVGLALMHGFSATNVGKSRLTLEPSTRNTGVFSKGRASAKSNTGKNPAAFLEDRFLNKPKERRPPASVIQPREEAKKAQVQRPNKKTKKPKERSRVSSECSGKGDTGSSLHEGGGTALRHKSSSVTWDIERDGVELASTDSSVPIALPHIGDEPSTTKKQEGDSLERTSELASDGGNSLVGPHDSASQYIPKPPSLDGDPRPSVDVFSKYFQQILDRSGEGEGERRPLRSMSCSPSPERANHASPNHMQYSGILIVGGSTQTREPDILVWEEGKCYSFQNEGEVGRGPIHEGVQSPELPEWPEALADTGQEMAEDVLLEIPALHSLYNVGRGETGVDTYMENRYIPQAGFPSSDIFDGYDDFEAIDAQDVWLEEFEGELGRVSYPHDTQGEEFIEGGFELLTDQAGGFYEAGELWDEGMGLDGETMQEEEYYGLETMDIEEHQEPCGSEPHYACEGGEEDVSEVLNDEPRDGLCQFLGGRSTLLGLNIERGRYSGLSAVEVDVAKSLKGHWRPQRL